MKWPTHGGQAHHIKQMFHLPQEEKLYDFSANLNPLGPPSWLKEKLGSLTSTVHTYPDPTYRVPREEIAKHEGISPDQVMMTNGGAEAIFIVAKLFEGKRSLIIQPTFSEYEQACLHYHVQTEELYLYLDSDFQFPLEEVLNKLKRNNGGHGVDVLFICRPNNPSGTLVTEEEIREVLEVGLQTGTTVVIDEAFVDFLPTSIPSLTNWIDLYPNLILLRSLTKMFTIPGLRLGYILSSEQVITTCLTHQIPWSVNSLAAQLVPLLLNDTVFMHQTRDWLVTEWKVLKRELGQLDFYLSPTNVNFYLLQDSRSHREGYCTLQEETDLLYSFLLKNGVIPRHTHNFKGLHGEYLRLAVRSEVENKRLIDILYRWREEK